ncbi:phage portal protein [Paenibacillus chitinolyticus]|uniref:phage portal protein n=1 Tax=Paenibacillus chitinolyticus TaxID=79263 RepID=UPI002DB6F7FB|nr:phage portal protein [Paenibacillus chitinolyticus]MEC0248896.1 phage portal protein [Paenibacillus chitinolyticus]
MTIKLRQRMRMAWDLVRNKASDYGGFAKWFSPKNIFIGRGGNALANNETIFAAISRLSNAMGSLPLKLYKDFKPVSTPISDLISNAPNGNMTSFDFIRTLEVHRDSYGNGYALKKYDSRYQVEALVILDPAKVEPVIEKDTLDLWYEINGDKGIYYVHNMDLIHVKHIHTTGYKGINPIDVLANTVDFDSKVRKFSLDQMDMSITASFILKMATNLSSDKKKEILDNFRSFYQDNGGVLIQETGTEITPIDRNFLDTKVFEVEKVTKSRVATVYNMPLHMVGETEGSSFSSMEQLSLEFVQGTLLPIVRQYEQEFNRKLLTAQERQRGLYLKFNLGALLRGDTQTRGEFYFKMIRSGVFKPNDARAWEELPPEPGGEKLYISGDLYPIDTPVEQRKGVKTE